MGNEQPTNRCTRRLSAARERRVMDYLLPMQGSRSKSIKNMQSFCFDLILMRLCAKHGIGPGFLIHDSHLFDGVDGRQVISSLKLGDVCAIRSGGTPSRSEKSFWNGDIPWVGSTVCKDEEVTKADEYITQEGLNNSAAKLFPVGTTLIALVGATIGKTGLLKFASTTNQNIAGLYPETLAILEPMYLFRATQMLYPEFLRLGEGKFRMAERKLVEANRELIARMEAKIKAKLAEVWGQETKNGEKAES